MSPTGHRSICMCENEAVTRAFETVRDMSKWRIHATHVKSRNNNKIPVQTLNLVSSRVIMQNTIFGDEVNYR
jgi:hypothetical protein